MTMRSEYELLQAAARIHEESRRVIRNDYAVGGRRPAAMSSGALYEWRVRRQEFFDHWLADDRESLASQLAAQFSSDNEYTGAEVIGRIRMYMHVAFDEHPEGERCLVCENDPDGS